MFPGMFSRYYGVLKIDWDAFTEIWQPDSSGIIFRTDFEGEIDGSNQL